MGWDSAICRQQCREFCTWASLAHHGWVYDSILSRIVTSELSCDPTALCLRSRGKRYYKAEHIERAGMKMRMNIKAHAISPKVFSVWNALLPIYIYHALILLHSNPLLYLTAGYLSLLRKSRCNHCFTPARLHTWKKLEVQ